MDGIPLVYNGMEIGDTGESGGPALTERVPLFWPIVERRPEFQAFYRSMIALRREHAALRLGRDPLARLVGPDRVVSFVRRGGGEEVLVAVNLSSQPFAGTVQRRPAPPFVEITPAVPLPAAARRRGPDRAVAGAPAHAGPRRVGLPALPARRAVGEKARMARDRPFSENTIGIKTKDGPSPP